MSMDWRGLLVDDRGRVTETKLWSHVGKLALTFAFVFEVLQPGVAPEWLFLVYGGLILVHDGYRRYLASKASKAA